jgi:DNA modification methylase
MAEILNKDIGIGNATIDDVTDMIDIWLAKRDAGVDYQHPTQKPITLHERPLNRCTKIGDNVLDLCGGSGSTLLACEQLKRNAFLVEMNPVFCQVIINRYENFSGNKAVKLN